jgi:hypothetical protein
MSPEKNEMIGGLEAGIGETRLEVLISERDGETVLSLQLSTWNEALGWQVQKTIPFAAKQLGQLQRLLAQARTRIADRHTTPGAAAQVIPLVARGPLTQAPAAPAHPMQSVAKNATS